MARQKAGSGTSPSLRTGEHARLLSKADALFARFPMSLCVAVFFVVSLFAKSETLNTIQHAQQSALLLQGCMVLVIVSITSLAKFHTSGLDNMPVSAKASLDQPIVLRILKMRHAFLTEVKYGLIFVLAAFVIVAACVASGLTRLDLNLCIVAHALASSLVVETFARLILLPMCKMQSFDDKAFLKSGSVPVAPCPPSGTSLEPAAWVYVRASCFSLHHFTCLWLAVCGLIARYFGSHLAIFFLLGLLLHLPAAVMEVLGFVTGDELHVSSFLRAPPAGGIEPQAVDIERQHTPWQHSIMALPDLVQRASAIWRYVVPVLPEAQQLAFWRHQRGGGILFKGLFVVAVLPTVCLCLLWIISVISIGTSRASEVAWLTNSVGDNTVVPAILFTTSQATVLLLLSTLGTIMDAVFFEAALEFTAQEQSNSTALLRWLSHECRSPVAAALLATDEVLTQMLPRLRNHVQNALVLASEMTHTKQDTFTGLATVPFPQHAGSVQAAPLSEPKHQTPCFGNHQPVLYTDTTQSKSPGLNISQPRRSSCASVGSPVSMQELERSLTHVGKNTAGAQLPLVKVKPQLLKLLDSSHHELRSIGDAVRMVQQPVDALSGVLDNMLLYLRNQRSGQKRKFSLLDASVQLKLGPAWEAAFRNARASSDTVDSSSKRFRFFIQAGSEAAAQDKGAQYPTLNIAEAVSKLHRVNCSSSFTQSTVVQVLTNFITNAMKYGQCAVSSKDFIDVRVCLLQSNSDFNAGPVSEGGQRAMAIAKRWMHEHLAGNGSTQGGSQQGSGSTCEPGVVHISVKDYGMGMKADELATLFQPFARLRSGATQKGTGLGLWLMRQLVESQGGSVAVTSPGEGQGSEFHMFAPALFWASLQQLPRMESWKKPEQPAAQSDSAGAADIAPPAVKQLRHSHTYGAVSIKIQPLACGHVADMHESAGKSRAAFTEGSRRRSLSPMARKSDIYEVSHIPDRHHGFHGSHSHTDFDSKAADPLAARSSSKGGDSGDSPTHICGPANANMSHMPAKQAAADGLASWKILLVDDAAAIRSMLQRQLRRHGHEVHIAQNGQAGFSCWKAALQQTVSPNRLSKPFDAVVTDITMPLLNGDEMVAKMLLLLKDQEEQLRQPAPVFIGATGNAMPRDISQYRNAGIDRVLLKPFTASDVLNSIAECMESHTP